MADASDADDAIRPSYVELDDVVMSVMLIEERTVLDVRAGLSNQ
jgi:hypothetical protein